METVTFPQIGLTLHLSKIAFKIGNVSIYWYAILIVIAILLAFFMYKKQDGKYGIFFKDILNMGIWVLPIAFIGARLYYVLFRFNYFWNNPLQIMNLQAGGLAIYGGILAGVITLFIYSKRHRMNFLNVLDYIVPGVALGQAIGRWGNFINVEAYGTQSSLWWRMGILKDGELLEVHPTFLYESLGTFLLFGYMVYRGKHRKQSGEVNGIYIMGYAFIIMYIEGLRTDSLYLGSIRISQFISIILFSMMLMLLIFHKKRGRSQKIKFTKNSHRID